MVLHVARCSFRGHRNLGVRMLCTVGFRQSPQIEDVAYLVFWLAELLGLVLRLSGLREHGLVARLAISLVVIWLLMYWRVVWGVLTLCILWQRDVIRWSCIRGLPPLGSVCPVGARITFLYRMALFAAGFTWVCYFSRCPIASVAGFSSSFPAVLYYMAWVATSKTRACWFGWIGGLLWGILYIDLVYSCYVGFAWGQESV